MEKDGYKFSRFMYILEAAFEYFIALLAEGAYLAKVTTAIGVPDSLTGILTSFVSLGCGFQIIAVFFAGRHSVKHWVTILHSLNQIFFALVYFVPFVKVSQTQKTLLFIVFLLSGHILNNIVNSPKINWFMSLVDDRKRGSFTAGKEMISLAGGVVFSFIVGKIIDHYEACGDLYNAFLFCGIGILVLMLLHTLTLILSREKPCGKTEKIPTKKLLSELFRNKDLLKVIFIFVLWNVANYATVPFYGTYQIKELGFSMTFVSILAALYAVCRSVFSKPMGRYADKYSFTKMLNICFIIQAFAFAVNIFAVPSNGKIFYTAYYMLFSIAMAGISSGSINLIYEYVDKEKRVGALALKNSLAGLAGFFATLATSVLVEHIQKNGNTFLGINVYAQQVVSAIGLAVVLLTLPCLNKMIRKRKDGELQKF